MKKKKTFYIKAVGDLGIPLISKIQSEGSMSVIKTLIHMGSEIFSSKNDINALNIAIYYDYIEAGGYILYIIYVSNKFKLFDKKVLINSDGKFDENIDNIIKITKEELKSQNPDYLRKWLSNLTKMKENFETLKSKLENKIRIINELTGAGNTLELLNPIKQQLILSIL